MYIPKEVLLILWALGALGAWPLLQDVVPQYWARVGLGLIWPVSLPAFGLLIAIEKEGEGDDL